MKKSKTTPIPRLRAATFLYCETQGRIFTARFRKKDGTMRDMTARCDVKKHLRGGELPYDPILKLLLPVFDMAVNDYRMINLLTLESFTVGGETFTVHD